MNISKLTMGGKCDEKCSISFQYTTSTTCVATNNGTYISISYNKSNMPPVMFNSLKYDVSTVELYSPSVHNFNNTVADAELIIQHTSSETGSPLLVCIPIMTKGASGTGTVVLTEIAQSVIQKPLQKNDPPMTIVLTDYNLNNIVPYKPFFYYNSPTNDANIIVFGLGESIYMDLDIVTQLRNLITPATDTFAPSVDNYIFYNNHGPSTSFGDGQLYINCSPTGNSEDTTDVDFDKTNTTTNYDLATILSNPVFLFILASLVFVIIIMVLHKILVSVTSDKTS